MIVDAKFMVSGSPVPRNNAYSVFAAVSKVLGGHLSPEIGVFPLGGKLQGERILLQPYSRLGFRCQHSMVADLMPLTGAVIEVNDVPLQVGSMSLEMIPTSSTMYAPSVYFKDRTDTTSFLKRAQYDLDRRGIVGTASIGISRHTNLPESRVLVIRDTRLVTFAVVVSGLSDEDAQRLVEEGMGGRRHMGCGLFIAARKD